MSKCRCRCYSLRPSVERPISDAHVFCPGGNQSPTHCREVANLFALLFADDQDGLRWRNVVPRMVFNFIMRRLKTFSQVLLRVRQSVSVTHKLIVADLVCSSRMDLTPGILETVLSKLWAVNTSGPRGFISHAEDMKSTRNLLSQVGEGTNRNSQMISLRQQQGT